MNCKKILLPVLGLMSITGALKAQTINSSTANGIFSQSKVVIANDSTSNNIYIGTDSTWSLIQLGRGDNSGLNILPGSGNIGVGTASPQSKFSVNGMITAKIVKVVQSGWADYVFDSAYALPTLHYVEQFVKENKHLPNVPSAKELTQTGLDLGQLQKVQMEKIEELTLYIIAQQKKMEMQEQQLRQLQQRLDALEKKK